MPRDSLLLIVAMVSLASCGRYSQDCFDEQGRGATGPTHLEVSCAALGSDLQCRAIADARHELYVYCPIPDQDVTAEASWMSSDDAVGMFRSPGILEVVAPGQLEVTARWRFMTTNPIAFLVAPRAVPEQFTMFYVRVTDLTNIVLPGVSVDVLPERGPSQACQTGSAGYCVPLWVLPSAVTLRGSKAGYQPAEIVVPAPEGFTQSATLRLAPLP